jgi:hypothetical protein
LFLEKITDEFGTTFEGYDLDKQIFDGTQITLNGVGITRLKVEGEVKHGLKLKLEITYEVTYKNGILIEADEMKDERGRTFDPVTRDNSTEMENFDENGIPNGRFIMTSITYENGKKIEHPGAIQFGNSEISKPKTGGKKTRKNKTKKTKKRHRKKAKSHRLF